MRPQIIYREDDGYPFLYKCQYYMIVKKLLTEAAAMLNHGIFQMADLLFYFHRGPCKIK